MGAEECPLELETTRFDLKCDLNNNHKALFIDFKNDIQYSLKCLKKLIELEKQKLEFSSAFDSYRVKYVIDNYNNDVVSALKAMSIDNERDRCEFIYNELFSSLDKKWGGKDHCNFCDNYCIAYRNNKKFKQEDGCCYSFENGRFFSRAFAKNKQKCKYLGENKSCQTQNISCKLYTCDYLKKHEKFELNLNDYLLARLFFKRKQHLILKNNFFVSKEEIIDKLMEHNRTPYLIYYWLGHYKLL